MSQTKSIISVVVALIAGMAFSAIPLPEHPRPDWERKDWINLNGQWDFRFSNEKEFTKKILVPFGWGTKLSGVKDEGDTGIYRRKVNIPESWKGKRIFIVIGASDHDTTVSFAGSELGKYVGGYTPFEFELTDKVDFGKDQDLEISVWDPPNEEARQGHYLYGKQGYGNARGIWQTVYLEARGENYADFATFIPSIKDSTVTANIFLGVPAKKKLPCSLVIDGKTHSFEIEPGQMSSSQIIKLENPKLWDLDNPYLYNTVLTIDNDVVHSYFGFREIGVAMNKPAGAKYITLNGKPVYLQLCLDQSYHPDGWYTFPTDEFMKNEILISKNLGLHGNRIHIKVEIPRKLYWADKLGVLIQADVPCAWGNVSDAMFEEHWKCFLGMVKRDFNHPSIYQWTLFNETWGLFINRSLSMGLASGAGGKKRVYTPDTQKKVAKAYFKAKYVDPTRLIEDNSPCNNDHVITDVNTWHAYAAGYRWENIVSNMCSKTYPGSKSNYIGGHVQGDEPMMNSECGNVWGYKGSTGDCDFTWDYHLMIDSFRRHLQCSGWLYTEHHDVINEWNGYVRFDRSPKYTGIEELFPGMSLKDLHADAYIPLDKELCRTSKPGEERIVPVEISLVTDKYADMDLSLSYDIRYIDDMGEVKEINCVEKKNFGKAASWQNGKLADVKVKLPSVDACGTINFTLYANNKAIAKNFTCFRVKSDNQITSKPVKAEWSLGTTNVLNGLKYNGFGKGFFEYEFTTQGGTFLAEVSTKRLNVKDIPETQKKGPGIDYMLGGGFNDRSKNQNSYPQTSNEKHPGEVKVYANGQLVATVALPDDPADHRGILSWASQLRDRRLREAGSYGYLVKAEIPKALVKDGKVTIRLEADKAGLAVYGADFGRYPFSPKIVESK